MSVTPRDEPPEQILSGPGVQGTVRVHQRQTTPSEDEQDLEPEGVEPEE